MISAPILILKSFSFYTDSVVKVLRTQFQGMAHVFDWKGDAKGNPTDFYKNLWNSTKDKYLAVIVLGDEPIEFAAKYIKEKPVIYIRNYHNMDTLFLPGNFVGVYAAIDLALHIEKLVCAIEEAKIMGVLIHRSEWKVLKDMFSSEPNIMGKNPINEIHIRLIDHPTEIRTALKDFTNFGIKVVYIPPISHLNYGKYLEEITKGAKDLKIAITSSDPSYVRLWSIYSWEPSPKDIGVVLLETIYEIDRGINLPKVKYSFISSANAGIPTINLSLAKKLQLKTSSECFFKEIY